MFQYLRDHISRYRFLYTCIIVSVLLRLVYVILFTDYQHYLASDMGAYDQRALTLLSGQHVEFSTYWAPFFHIFLAGLYWPVTVLHAVNSRLTLYVAVMALLSVITLVCTYHITIKIFGKKAAYIAVAATAVWYPLIYLNVFVLSENLYIPLLYFGLYLIICRARTSNWGFWAGLILGLATIDRPILLVFLPMLVLWLLVQRISRRYILILITAATLVIGVQCIYNHFYTNGGTNFISAGGGFNFAMTWCDMKSLTYQANGYAFGFGPPANVDYDASRDVVTTVPFENQNYYYDLGLQCIRTRPIVIIYNLRSVKNLFYSYIFPRSGSVSGWEQLHEVFVILDIIVFALAAVTFIFSNRLKPVAEAEVMLLALLVFSLFVSAYLQNPGEERYLYPYLPALLILASWPLVQIRRIKFKRRRKVR